jgi:hypothetical protein
VQCEFHSDCAPDLLCDMLIQNEVRIYEVTKMVNMSAIDVHLSWSWYHMEIN